jgi:hypothetical protein
MMPVPAPSSFSQNDSNDSNNSGISFVFPTDDEIRKDSKLFIESMILAVYCALYKEISKTNPSPDIIVACYVVYLSMMSVNFDQQASNVFEIVDGNKYLIKGEVRASVIEDKDKISADFDVEEMVNSEMTLEEFAKLITLGVKYTISQKKPLNCKICDIDLELD